MRSYIAWLNGTSVACGTRADVERKAREIVATERWQEWGFDRDGVTTLRITRGARQLFVAAYTIRKGDPVPRDVQGGAA